MAARKHTARRARLPVVFPINRHVSRNDAAKAFGAALRAARKAAGMTQQDLAEAAELHRTYPSLLELGQRTPTLSVIIRLAKVLNLDPSELLKAVDAGTEKR